MKVLDENIRVTKSVESKYPSEEETVQAKLAKMNELLSKTDLSNFYKSMRKS
ncbi:MAG: hypothetical protein RLZZ306_1763 [Bacteroidota bacterium]|jgi:hypothetical protein